MSCLPSFLTFSQLTTTFRAVQLHQKLSSPLRKKSGEHSIKILEEKQVKAEMFRVKKKEEIAIKSKNLSEKVIILNAHLNDINQ